MKIFLSLSPTFLRGGSLKTYHVLRSKNLDSLDKFETKVMQGIDGLMFKGDASHKVTKLIYVNTDEKVYHGLYTIMNEYGQVTGWWFIRTGKMEELESSRGHIHMVSTLPLNMSTANALQIQKQGPLIYPGQTPPVIVDVSNKRTLDRAPQICSTCLHFRHHNILYKDMHYNRCVVPANLRSTENSVEGWCACKDCVEGAESLQTPTRQKDL